MDAKTTWLGDMRLEGTADTGFKLNIDSPADPAHAPGGFKPTELLAIGACGCTSMDVISILKKKKVNFTGLEVKVHVVSETETHPHVFKQMDFEYIITGKQIQREDVERAVQLSETKYCQCIAMLGKTAKINHTITINEA